MTKHRRSSYRPLMILVVLLSIVSPALAQPVIYVSASATGAADGSTWADADTAVQPALSAATSGDQVWVAADTYVGTITLKLGVALYGGFAGIEDPATFDLADFAVLQQALAAGI